MTITVETNTELSESTMQADQILQARAILDEIYNDPKNPLHDPKHPRHHHVFQAVDALESELFRLTCVVDEKKAKRHENTKPE